MLYKLFVIYIFFLLGCFPFVKYTENKPYFTFIIWTTLQIGYAIPWFMHIGPKNIECYSKMPFFLTLNSFWPYTAFILQQSIFSLCILVAIYICLWVQAFTSWYRYRYNIPTWIFCFCLTIHLPIFGYYDYFLK